MLISSQYKILPIPPSPPPAWSHIQNGPINQDHCRFTCVPYNAKYVIFKFTSYITLVILVWIDELIYKYVEELDSAHT